MRCSHFSRWFGLLLGLARVSGTALGAEVPLTREQVDGRALAAEMIAMQPATGATNEAVLERRDAEGKRTRIPLTIVTLVGGGANGEWSTTYTARTPGSASGDILEIRHGADRAPRYLHGSEILTASQASLPFAGSDFWLDDLGLEFLYWPDQRIIPGPRNDPPMVKGRSCKILESRNPAGAPYSRVVSWVDHEFKTLIQADAYDASGKLLKRFSIGSVKKVNGVWQLKDMEMIDERRDTKTRLEFELKVRE